MSVAFNIPFALGLGTLDPVRLLGEGISNIGLSLITPWVLNGTKAGLEEVAHVISAETSPDVTSGWFSGEYWRVAALASMLTLPFIFAAALQALLRSEPGLIFKVVFAYLPVAMIGISIASPVVMLMLSATNEMCSIVSATGVNGGARFLDAVAIKLAANTALGGSPFFAVVVGLCTLFAALMLTLELLIREASVYIVVLMLPLAFAAMVWPARRIWAVRVVELLTSLILAKFVIVSVLSLAGSALGSGGGVNPMLTAMTLVMLSTLAPWALMRLLPFTEVAAAASGTLRQEAGRPFQTASANAKDWLDGGADRADAATPRLGDDQPRSDLFTSDADDGRGGGGGGGADGGSGAGGGGGTGSGGDGGAAGGSGAGVGGEPNAPLEANGPRRPPSGSAPGGGPGSDPADADGSAGGAEQPPWAGTDFNPRVYQPNGDSGTWELAAGSDSQVREAIALGQQNDSVPILPRAAESEPIFVDDGSDEEDERP